jgi:hypothetical protein
MSREPRDTLFPRREPRDSSAIVGGINLGDRFADWRDFSVRLPKEPAEDLCRYLRASGGEAWAGGRDDTALRATPEPPPAGAAGAAAVAAVSGVLCSAVIGWWLVPALLLGPFFAAATHGVTAPLNAGAAASGAAVAVALGAATDGRGFSLARELGELGRALLYDRSRLGDALAPLRPGAAAAGGGGGAGGGAGAREAPPARERRLSPPLAEAAARSPLVSFAANRREAQRFEIEPAFRAIFADEELTRYRVVLL